METTPQILTPPPLNLIDPLPQSVLDVADLGAGLHHPERGGDALLRPPLPLQSAGVDLHRVATGEVFVTSDTVTYILLPDTRYHCFYYVELRD